MWHPLNLTPVFIIVAIVTTLNIKVGHMPGDKCENDFFDCDYVTTGLRCDLEKGLCGCLVNLSYFDYYNSHCYIQQNGTCPGSDSNIACTPNSNCDSQNFICLCEPEYPPTPNHKCAKEYNSTCGRNSDCDVDKYFQCVNFICQCPYSAKFDPVASHCITNIGERCDYPPTPCTRNATCTRTCECDEPFAENEEKLCRIPYDELCTESQYCDEKKYLICKTGACLCEDRAIYDEVEETCKILVDQKCEDTFLTGQLCVNHATCKKNNLNQYVCLCDDSFSQSATHHCYRSYGQSCDANLPCDHELFHECIDDLCHCHGPEHSWYNTTTHNCSLLAGATCGLDPNFPMNCIENSYCAPRTDVCTCSENMTPNDDRFCVLSHNQLCDSTYDNCDSSQFFICDPTLLRCSCINPLNTLWDPTDGVCKLRAGQICNNGGIPDCVSNSECVYLYPSQQFQCECIGNLIQSTFGKCVLPYSSSCTPGLYDLCNDDGHQRCRDGHCLCTDDDHMVIDPTNNNCYLTWNSPCHADGVLCLGNLTCSSSGFCRCDESLGFVDNGDGQCIGGWGSRCDDNSTDNNGGCSVDHLLECVEGTCECLPSYSAIDFGENNSSIKCLGNEGVLCESKMDCNTNASLNCNSGRCSCYISDEQFYDPVAKKCFVKMNGRCHLMTIPEQIPLFCDPQYTCQQTNDTTNPNMGRCLCEAGNVELCSAGTASIGQIFFVFIIGFCICVM